MFVLRGQVKMKTKIRTGKLTQTAASHTAALFSHNRNKTFRVKKPDWVSHLHPHTNANPASRRKVGVLN